MDLKVIGLRRYAIMTINYESELKVRRATGKNAKMHFSAVKADMGFWLQNRCCGTRGGDGVEMR